jgi:hypothetical protein
MLRGIRSRISWRWAVVLGTLWGGGAVLAVAVSLGRLGRQWTACEVFDIGAALVMTSAWGRRARKDAAIAAYEYGRRAARTRRTGTALPDDWWRLQTHQRPQSATVAELADYRARHASDSR